MQSFKQFLEEGIDYFVVEISDNKLIDKLSLLNEGDWVQSGKKDWMIRVDSPKPEIKQQRHVHVARERHVKNKTMQASWNQDGSKHDKKTYNSKIGSLDVVQSIAKQALGLPANAKLEEAAKASRLLFLLNESENELGITPVLFILKVA